MIEPRESIPVTLRDGASTIVRRLGSGPKVLFSHGSGYASDAFATFLHRLADRCEVYCVDLRGHGIGPRIDVQDFSLELLTRDFHDIIRALRDEYGAHSIHGVFHSIAAVLALRVQAENAAAFRSIVGYEPPVPAAGPNAQEFVDGAARMATRALRRRRAFATAGELADRFRESGTLVAGGEAAALCLANGVLGEAVDGLRPLRCEPEIEAGIYTGNSDTGLWQAMQVIRCPGLIVRGRRPGGNREYTDIVASRVADALRFDLLTLHGLGHLGWIEAPDKSAEIVASFVHAAADA